MPKVRNHRRLLVASSVAALTIVGGSIASASSVSPLALAAAAFQHTGGSGQSGGSGHSGTSHDSGQSSHDSGQSGQMGQGKGGGKKPGETARGGGHGSMEDIYREIGEAEDSDRPAWAGTKGGKNEHGTKPSSAGSKKGDLYGDLYVILRDANGVPILSAAGFVQPLDANGNPIPLDAEGAPIDPTLAIPVEFSRLSVGRSPSQVLDRRATEVVTMLNTATAISVDQAGRLVVTGPDGVASTIDSPLENLALYVALMTGGTIPGVTDLPGTQYDYLVDGKFTTQDLQTAAGLFAAAADKYASVSPDTVAYMNAILGINTKTTGTITYSSMDYSSYTYDRSDAYDGKTVSVLVKQADGSYLPTTVNLYDAVFKDADYSGTGFDAFAKSVDDARAVIAYIHDNEAPQ
jgi:hypothetical protein